jgi:hypothetical protein
MLSRLVSDQEPTETNPDPAPQVCTTLGMVNQEQARQLREAGLTAYNHNLDTSPEYYGKITTTRKYEVCVMGGGALGCYYTSALAAWHRG